MRIPGIAELLRPAPDGLAVDEQRQATGREEHPQKITVYLSTEELLDLEHARLILRGFGIPVDRGRLVREAITVLLADLDARGQDSVLATRLLREAQRREAPPPVAQAQQAQARQVLPRQALPRQAPPGEK